MEKNVADIYVNQITNGRTNGYGMVESLSHTQQTILCNAIKEITGKEFGNPYRPADYIKDFTLSSTQGEHADQRLFDRYVQKASSLYADLMEAYDYDVQVDEANEKALLDDFMNDEMEQGMRCRHYHDMNIYTCDNCTTYPACCEAHQKYDREC